MMTLRELLNTYPDETACKRFLQDRRWPHGVRCPRCDNEKVYALHTRPFHWVCRNCAPNPRYPYRFSVIVGTVFENTNCPLRTWFEVLWQMLNSKKGVSAKQIERQVGCSYPTAWYMCHRLRAGMQDREFKKLVGVVEVDETFIGGKAKNRHLDRRGKGGGTGGIGSGKTPIAGAVSRKGNVVARVVENVRASTLTEFIRESVSDRVSLLITDQWMAYRKLHHRYPHQVINHLQGEYVIGAVHTNTIEGFWSLVKRGVVGTFHKVSKKYLPLYVAEFQFRYNNRTDPDIFGAAIAGC